jgi:hypothetical protein
MNSYLMKIKRFEYLIALIGYFLVALFILNRILFAYPGTIGFFHDWPIGPYPEMNQQYSKGGLYIWDASYNGGNKLYPTDWIFRVSLIPFSFLGGEILTKGILLLIITLSGFGAFCLGKQLKLSPFSSFAVGILFIFSPIVFTRIVAGHIYYLAAYFLSPFIVTLFLKGRGEQKKEEKEEKQKQQEKAKIESRKNNFKYFIIAGILTAFAAIQLQFLVMIFIVLLIFSVIDIARIKKSAIGLVIVFSIAALINLSPTVLSEVLMNKTSSNFNPLLLLSFDEVTQAPNLTKSLRLLGYESHPYSYGKIGTSEDPLFKSDINKAGNNKTNLVTNPDLVLISSMVSNSTNTFKDNININNNPSQSRLLPLPVNWSDPYNNCNSFFKCTVITSKEIIGLQNNSTNSPQNSLQASTNTTNKNRWSFINGNQIDVNPGEQYAIITHMKLNEFVIGSHIAIQGYNQTSKKWNHLYTQCPPGINGPLEWKEYSCEITIPANTDKIRPLLNAGWSYQPGKQAVTLFGPINISKLYDIGDYQNIPRNQMLKKIISELRLPPIYQYKQVNPTLWHVNVNNADKPFVLSFAEPYDPLWEAIVYKDGKKVDVAKPGPLYSGINSFQINHTGNLDIVIRYKPQDWFEIGLIISGLTLFFCLLLYFFSNRIKDKVEKWIQKSSNMKRLLNRQTN